MTHSQVSLPFGDVLYSMTRFWFCFSFGVLQTKASDQDPYAPCSLPPSPQTGVIPKPVMPGALNQN